MIRKLVLVALPAIAVLFLSGTNSAVRSWASDELAGMTEHARLVAARNH